ncbi:MAG TPA: type II toxin-antitoxin system VapC family toxin [Solirubrobacterales bacterium]|nr:type II toxin-antitoxin system VapC family toxin [Solirubrobacterales bacterium]
MPVYYADASALVKLVRQEAESDALRAYIGDADLVSSELALTEIPRAIHRIAARDRRHLTRLLEQAEEVIDRLALRPLDSHLLATAGALAEPALRALDAIHVATAIDLHPIESFVTYDERQAAAARLAGVRTVAPGL